MAEPPVAEVQNPYPGLRPFRTDEKHLFFGREEQVDRMVEKLAARRFLAVVGGSGSGKSSLVNCGLKPALHRGNMAAAGSHWRMAQMRPGSDPLGALAAALAEPGVLFDEPYEETPGRPKFPHAPSGGLARSDRSGGTFMGAVSTQTLVLNTLRLGSLGLVDIVEQADLPAGTQLLVVADQFEELFRFRRLMRGADEQGYAAAEDAVAFVRLLLQAAAQSAVPIHVVLTMRSDFLGDCAQFSGLPEAINEGQYLVPRLTRAEVESAITGPAAVRGVGCSPVLVNRLLNDVGDNPDQLSILQHVLNRSWYQWQKAGSQGELLLQHYIDAGEMGNALNLHANRAFAEISTEAGQTLCRKVFQALTDTGTDARGTRRPTRLDSLCRITGASQAEVVAVIDVFRKPSRSFLMPPAGDELTPASVIDISHESLMRLWQLLKAWADDEAQSARIYRRLHEAAAEFDAGRASLWTDPQLALALKWRDDKAPTEAWAQAYGGGFESAIAFLDKSRAAQEAERKEAAEEARWHAVWSYVPLALMGLLFVLMQILLEPALQQAMSILASSYQGGYDWSGARLAGGLFSHLLAGMPAAVGYVLLAAYVRRNFPQWEARWAARAARRNAASRAGKTAPRRAEEAADGAASFGARCLAQGIDWLLCLAMWLAALFFSVAYVPPKDGAGVMIVLMLLSAAAYHIPLWTSPWQATLGMKVARIVVTDKEGHRLGPWRATARFFARWLSYYTAGLGFLMALFSKDNRTLHDRMTGTLMMRRAKAG